MESRLERGVGERERVSGLKNYVKDLSFPIIGVLKEKVGLKKYFKT